MSFLTSEDQGTLSRLMGGDHRGSLLATRDDHLIPRPGWIMAGIVALGLGLAAWHFLGPDVRRYIKMHNM
jgi:hypothetical protein